MDVANSKNTMVGSIEDCNGNVNCIIKYLVDNLVKISKDNNIVTKMASCNGRLDVLKYIFDNELCDDKEEAKNYAAMLASLNNHNNITEFVNNI
jgi:hypothetical protein